MDKSLVLSLLHTPTVHEHVLALAGCMLVIRNGCCWLWVCLLDGGSPACLSGIVLTIKQCCFVHHCES